MAGILEFSAFIAGGGVVVAQPLLKLDRVGGVLRHKKRVSCLVAKKNDTCSVQLLSLECHG